jgi:hypothetical protein
LFLSFDHNYLLEILDEDRKYLYSWSNQKGSDDPVTCNGEWVLIRNISEYDIMSYGNPESDDGVAYPVLMNPSFTKMLYFNNGTLLFEILDSITGNKLHDVPSHAI